MFIALLARASPFSRMPWIRALRDITHQWPEVVRAAVAMTDRRDAHVKATFEAATKVTKPSTSAARSDDDCDESIDRLDILSLDGSADQPDANKGKVTRWVL